MSNRCGFVGETKGFEVAGLENGTRVDDSAGVHLQMGLQLITGRLVGAENSGKRIDFLTYFFD